MGRYSQCSETTHNEIAWNLKAGRLGVTVKPVYNDHIIAYFSAFCISSLGHLDELQKAEIVSKISTFSLH